MTPKLVFFITASFLIIATARGYIVNARYDNGRIYNQQFSYLFTPCQAVTPTSANSPSVPLYPIGTKNISYLLYTQRNPNYLNPQVFFMSNTIQDIQNSNIDFSKNTILYIHGLNETYVGGAQAFTQGLLAQMDVNIFITNYDMYALFNPDDYSDSITIPRLANITADFVLKLIAAGVDRNKIQLIGFSAGGQAVGLTGKRINPKVGRILAVDPQGGCYDFSPDTQRLVSTDAQYVEIMHCSIGVYATQFSNTGTSTFYFNNALIQPQCAYLRTSILDENHCSHRQCKFYLYASLQPGYVPFQGIGCNSVADFRNNKCNGPQTAPFQYNVSTSVTGLYKVTVTDTITF